MRKSLLSLLFLGCLAQPAFSQNPDWRDKIDPRLWDYAQKPDSAVEFLIIMQKQADVSAAKQLRTKVEKGKYVFETLAAFAENDQRTVRDVLQNEGVPLHSFWIINALWAKGNRIPGANCQIGGSRRPAAQPDLASEPAGGRLFKSDSSGSRG